MFSVRKIACYVAGFTGILLSQVLITSADDEKVVSYTSENFAEAVQTNNHFVMFYAPWCGHCKRLHPVWEQLAEKLDDDVTQLTIAKVDCTTDHELCTQHDVTGYPTLKFFKLGSDDAVKFRGTRDLPSLTSFISEQLGTPVAPTADPSEERGVTELTEESFDSITSSGSHFVKFYAPWCGHCQKLAPTWDELGERVGGEGGALKVGKVDCTVHRGVCNKLQIKGYPTLLFIKDGEVVEKYSGQRTLEELQRFVRRMSGRKSEEEGPEGGEGSEGGVPLLNASTFTSGVSQGVTFVKFFAPWCGHCKRLAPTWTELSLKVKEQPNVRLVRVDCTLPDSKELCNEQEVEGFPTLLVYRDGVKVSEYNGARNVDEMYQYLANFFRHDEL